MSDLGMQFSEIMKDKMGSLPLGDIAIVYQQKTIEDTRRGVDPSGTPFPEFAPSTVKKKGRTSPVTMRDKDFSIEKLDFDFDEDITLYFPEKDEIFAMHQDGSARGGNVRKLFPEAEDEDSALMQDSYKEVETILEGHFNE